MIVFSLFSVFSISSGSGLLNSDFKTFKEALREILRYLTGSPLWATALSIIFYASASTAAGFLEKKSAQLKPIGSGLNLIILFISVQLFLHLGAAVYFPRVSQQLNFFSWPAFTYAALHIYGDLFIMPYASPVST